MCIYNQQCIWRMEVSKIYVYIHFVPDFSKYSFKIDLLLVLYLNPYYLNPYILLYFTCLTLKQIRIIIRKAKTGSRDTFFREDIIIILSKIFIIVFQYEVISSSSSLAEPTPQSIYYHSQWC